MVKYLVDRMVVADSKFDKVLEAVSSGLIDVTIVEEILYESRSDGRRDFFKKYSNDEITQEHIDILKKHVVNEIIDCGALLPDEGTGETMLAAEYWCKGLGMQTNLFGMGGKSEKTVVTDDKKALKYFESSNASVMSSNDFFEIIRKANSMEKSKEQKTKKDSEGANL